jgi:two-component system OmpR family sensor kinase
MRRFSIKWRLVVWLTGGTVLFWLGTALLGTYVMRHEFEEVFDSALQETAQRLIPLIVDELEQREDANEARSIDDGAVPEHEEYLTYQVRDPNGRVMLRSHDAPLLPFEAPLAQGFADTPSERVYTEAAARGSFFLQISDPFAHRREAMLEAASALFLPVLALAPLSILAIWLIVRTSVAPISSLRREIGMRHGGNLAPLYARRLPAELEGIAKSVDRLLERLRSALEAERHFASNAAHELRTPIAGALAQTQRLLAELPPGKERKRARKSRPRSHVFPAFQKSSCNWPGPKRVWARPPQILISFRLSAWWSEISNEAAKPNHKYTLMRRTICHSCGRLMPMPSLSCFATSSKTRSCTAATRSRWLLRWKGRE